MLRSRPLAVPLLQRVTLEKPVGASLLAMEVNYDAGSLAPRGALRFFASKLAPTEPAAIGHPWPAAANPRRPTGRPVCWLGSARFRPADRPPSRASSPPQKSKGRSAYIFALHHSSGRALARLQLLILIHPPPRQAERRCSSGDGRAAPFDAVELIACRSKRSRPEGNAPG
ncbi:hypothetical protein PputUW4_01411 [Pseudomonas sp. UW4]|nr:hypothetical protein PputUW4_01411 [Pseudomonas sp. UW4]